MQRRTPNELVDIIQNLYSQHLSVAEVARRTDVHYSTVWGYTAAKKKGFASRGAYLEDLAKKKGFASYGAYQEDLAKKKGFASYGAYQEDWAKKKGFASYGAYQEDLAKKRQQQPKNRELSDLITQRLKKMRKNQSWLAEQLGISRQVVSLYIKGSITPNGDSLKRLFSVIQVTHQTLNDLLE